MNTNPLNGWGFGRVGIAFMIFWTFMFLFIIYMRVHEYYRRRCLHLEREALRKQVRRVLKND